MKPLGAVRRGDDLGQRHRARGRARARDRPRQAVEELSEAQRRVILFGTGDERVSIRLKSSWGSGAFKMRYEGVINSMLRRMRETKSEEMRQHYQKYLSTRPARPAAGGGSGPRRSA